MDPARADANRRRGGGAEHPGTPAFEPAEAVPGRGDRDGSSPAELLQLEVGSDEATTSSRGLEVLIGASPRHVLQRLVQGDPLDLERRCLERLRHHATLVSGDRLYDRAAAWVAHESRSYDGELDLDSWLRRCIDQAIRGVLDEDLEAESCGVPPSSRGDSAFSFLSEALGVEPPIARRCALVFNRLPLPVRRTFWLAVLQNKGLHRAVAEGYGPPELAKARLRYALGMMSTLGEWDGPNPDPDAPDWIHEDDPTEEGRP